MKEKITILLFLCLMGLDLAHGQSTIKKDTVYYLLDTLKTPINDRMITSGIGGPQRFYTIECPCLSGDIKPQFRCNVTKQAFMSETSYKSLRLISLPSMIEFVKKNDNDDFDDKFVIYFIEPAGKRYIKNRFFFMGSKKVVVE